MLVNALREIQARENLSDQQFADRLGIHRISWSRIKNGRAPFGRKFLSCARQAYPELKDVIDIFLATDATIASERVATVNNKEG